MLPKNQIGDIGEQACIARLLMMGYAVLRPIGNHKFDIVYIDNKKFIKAQIKVGWLKGPSIAFNVIPRDMVDGYKNKIDVFLVYFNGRIFKVPADKVKGQRRGFLHLGITEPAPLTRLLANDYELLPKEQRWLDSIKQD